MATRRIPRPVKVDPPMARAAFVDPATGVLTSHGLKMLSFLRDRTGGDVDLIDSLLALTGISQISSLTAASNEERTRRMLGDALQQIQAQNVERLRSLFDDFRKTSDAQFGQLIGGLARPPQTRIITFSDNDTWRPSPDLRSIQVFAVGGGGGGGGGNSAGNGGGGGGGANFSWAAIDPRLLPDSVAVTVGAAGAAGAAGGDGGAGGDSSFGDFIAAKGGAGGLTAGAGGAANTLPGGLFMGGAGGAGGTGGAADGAPNDCLGCPGGGGGAFYSVDPEPGGSGAAGGSRTTASTGGGGIGGLAAGGDGGGHPTSGTYIGPGFGGGGGGSTSGASGSGGAGFNGAGGGGGGARAGNARPGGAGGAGRVWVVEIY